MPNDDDDDSRNSQDRYSLKDAAEVFGDFEESFDGFARRRSRPPEATRRPSQPQVGAAPAVLDPAQHLQDSGADSPSPASASAQADTELSDPKSVNSAADDAAAQQEAGVSGPPPSASLEPEHAPESRDKTPEEDVRQEQASVARRSPLAEAALEKGRPLPSPKRPAWLAVAAALMLAGVAATAYTLASREARLVQEQPAGDHELISHEPFIRAVAEFQEQLEAGDCEAALDTLRRYPKFSHRHFYAGKMRQYVEVCGPPPPIQVLGRSESALMPAESAGAAEPAKAHTIAPQETAQPVPPDKGPKASNRTKQRRDLRQVAAPGPVKAAPAAPASGRAEARSPDAQLEPLPIAAPSDSSAQPELPVRSPPWAKPQTEAAPKGHPGTSPAAQQQVE